MTRGALAVAAAPVVPPPRPAVPLAVPGPLPPVVPGPLPPVVPRPRALDLFAGAGGASMGYYLAGFDVVGVDINPQPNYPFEFHQADALTYPLDGFDLVHASPSCQWACTLTLGTNAGLGRDYPRPYPQIRDRLLALGIPAVIENPEARPDVVLCGEMFGLGVIRHRKFELLNWSSPQPMHLPHRGRVRGWRYGRYFDGPYIAAYGKGGGKGSAAEMQQAMGIDWTAVHGELTEAIPPAYTRHLGDSAREWLTARP